MVSKKNYIRKEGVIPANQPRQVTCIECGKKFIANCYQIKTCSPECKQVRKMRQIAESRRKNGANGYALYTKEKQGTEEVYTVIKDLTKEEKQEIMKRERAKTTGFWNMGALF